MARYLLQTYYFDVNGKQPGFHQEFDSLESAKAFTQANMCGSTWTILEVAPPDSHTVAFTEDEIVALSRHLNNQWTIASHLRSAERKLERAIGPMLTKSHEYAIRHTNT